MNTTTSTTTNDAIQEARLASDATGRAHKALLDAAAALHTADTAFRATESHTAWLNVQDAINALANAARIHTDALLHEHTTRAALEIAWTHHLQTNTPTRTLDADEQTGILKDYSAALLIPCNTKAAEYALYAIEDATNDQLDRRIVEHLDALADTPDYDGDPANEDVLAFVRSLHGTPFETYDTTGDND